MLSPLPMSRPVGRRFRHGPLAQGYFRPAFQAAFADGTEAAGSVTHPSWSDWAALSESCCLLRTNLTETDPATLWKKYIQLTEAEWAFRIKKNELGIQPIRHQKKDRVLGHVLVCFLGYVLWKALAQWMHRAGLGDAPRTSIEEFAKIKSSDVVLPAKMDDGSRRTIHLRCVTTPDEAQKVLLNRLGLTLPQRLRRLDEFAPM